MKTTYNHVVKATATMKATVQKKAGHSQVKPLFCANINHHDFTPHVSEKY